jgi:predicted nucleic acid-binding Zn ribbon protein
MFGSFLQPQYMPCPECGASVLTVEMDEHVCSPERRLDYQMFQLRAEIAFFELHLAAYLASPEGRFAEYYAERQRVSA